MMVIMSIIAVMFRKLISGLGPVLRDGLPELALVRHHARAGFCGGAARPAGGSRREAGSWLLGHSEVDVGEERLPVVGLPDGVARCR